jgi:hypothetical protein
MTFVSGKWGFQPKTCVGPFRFGHEVDKKTMETLDLEVMEEESDPSEELVAYAVSKPDVRVYTVAGKVAFVACYESLEYDGVQLIGLTQREMEEKLGRPSEWGEPLWIDDGSDPGFQQPIEYDSLGLQLWLRGGTVVSASCRAEAPDID